MKIKYVKHSIANTFNQGKDAYIEMNVNLKKYPKLHKQILAHEKGHLKLNGKMDFWYDLKESFNFKNQIELLKFQFKYPASLLQMSPVLYTKKGFAFDYFLIIIYLIGIITIGRIL